MSGIIQNCQNLEATRCTEVDEQTVVHPHDRIKLSVKKK
jgi:hypothetical protein